MHTEGGGGDSVGATWKLPGAEEPTNGTPPIAGQYMGVFLDPNGASVNISQQPANVTLNEGLAATLSVTATGTSAYGTNVVYQWQKANKGSTGFTNVANAAQSSLTTPALAQADSGVHPGCS